MIRILGVGLAMLLGFGLWYDLEYSMDVIEDSSYNNEVSAKRILLASQGSEYKNDLTAKLIQTIDPSFFIQVTDVSRLQEASLDYDLYIIIHTWEMWKPPDEVNYFLQTLPDKDRVFLVGTSGSGELSISDIDGITSASSMTGIDAQINQISDWIEAKEIFRETSNEFPSSIEH